MLPILGVDISKDDLDLRTVQQAEQEKFDIALVGEKNTHAIITARAKQAQGDYEANLKHQDLAKEIGSSTALTKSFVFRLTYGCRNA